MTTLDFRPTTTELARLVRSVDDHRLGDPTPCPDYTVADLLDHIGGLALAFTCAARKEDVPGGGDPSGDGSRLEQGWRDRISTQLGELGKAWLEPAAYDGMTMAGPIEMPAEIAALVALDEVTVHAWDLAVATGQAYDADPAAVEACAGFVAQFDAPTDGTLYGPPVAVPWDAPPLDRLLGATGRDPRWSPPSGSVSNSAA